MVKSSRFLVGALVGAAAGLLLAPVEGKKARAKLSKLAERAGLDPKKLEASCRDLLKKGEALVEEKLEKAGPKKKKTNKKK